MFLFYDFLGLLTIGMDPEFCLMKNERCFPLLLLTDPVCPMFLGLHPLP